MKSNTIKTFSNNTAAPAQLNMVVALACEVKPLIEYYQLKKDVGINKFAIYANQDKSIQLIIAGVGKIHMAAAVSYLQQYGGDKSYASFLNIGIAGAADLAVGELVLSNKISDIASAKSFYPRIYKQSNFRQAALQSFDSPQGRYPDNAMIDMEASAFFQAANLFVTQEQILIAKIISDNNKLSQQAINANFVTELISAQLAAINKLVNYLLELSQSEYEVTLPPKDFDKFIQHWHFTQAQQQQLRELLRQVNGLNSEFNCYEACRQFSNAKEIIIYLKTRTRIFV